MATGAAYGGYALLAFGDVSKRQMASFDVGGFVYLLWSFEVFGKPCRWSVRVRSFA